MGTWLLWAVIGPLFAIMIVLAFLHLRSERGRWRKLAEQLGLTLVDQGPVGIHVDMHMAGKWKGIPVTVRHETRGRGRGAHNYTVVEARLEGELPEGLDISREKLGRKLGKLLGGEDIQIGDPEFDKLADISADAPLAVKELLRDERVRRPLARLLGRHSGARVTADTVSLTERTGTIPGQKELAARLDDVWAAAFALSKASRK